MKNKFDRAARSRAKTKNAPVQTASAVDMTIDVSLGHVLTTLVGREELNDCPGVRAAFPFEPSLVPQTRDLFNLFDTTPDLSGADVDISRFVRDGEDLDVLVFWREEGSEAGQMQLWKSGHRAGCPFKRLLPARDELCPVATWRFRGFFAKLTGDQKEQVWVRDYRKGWLHLDDSERIFPGQVFLLSQQVGGYDRAAGWTGVPGAGTFEPCPAKEQEEETTEAGDATQEDEGNAVGQWQSIHLHSVAVAKSLTVILRDPVIHDSLMHADVLAPVTYMPPWHDIGKAQEKFFAKLTSSGRAEWPALGKGDHPAKAPRDRWKSFFHDDEDRAEFQKRFKRRPGFRHELASALALLESLRLASPNHPALSVEDELRAAFPIDQRKIDGPDESACALASLGPIADLERLNFNLLLYLIACHHGKERLGLRSSEDDYDLDQADPVPEVPSRNGDPIRRCRGVQDGDVVSSCRLPDPSKSIDEKSFVETPAFALSLELMEAFSLRYGASWADRMRELLQTLGPFRLAYLEALVRAADGRGSTIRPEDLAPA